MSAANSHSKSLCITALLAMLAGCMNINIETNFVIDQEVHSAIIDQTSDRFPEIDPLYISDELKKLIDDNIDPRDGEETRVELLQDILYDEEFLDIQYSSEQTHTAMEAFYAREGNCLSIMNLYVAMARHVNIDAHFQTVEVQPGWDRRGDLMVLSQHINASGRISARRTYIVDFTPEISLQTLSAEIISDQDARSLYFNNLGVEELIDGNFEQALVYFKNALFLDEYSSIAWNNIGSTYNRLGNTQFALYSYRMAFDADDNNATAISNLAKHYRRLGNFELANEYELAIQRFNERNPYYHFTQGSVAFERNDMDAARRAFRRALRLKEAEPDFYFALASVYLKMGDEPEAARYIRSAEKMLALHDEIYQPGNQKVRIIDSSTILRESSQGISIFVPDRKRRRE